MAYETEIKFPVADHRAVARRLREAGGEALGAVLQTDRFFDTPDRELLRSDRGLRVRTTVRLRGPRDRDEARPLLTYKGPREAGRTAKTRLEAQTHVDDPTVLGEIFGGVGLRQVLVIQKRRTSFRLGACLVELDELPRIGRFVEIEGPSERAILAVRRKLGLDGEAIAETYVALVEAVCGRLDTCREVTFDRCEHCALRG
ncbi:MAG TPA: class IV adenylate cyclase [Phycisphaerae bacterium]|nr:class IV adenylate cyclase [Phycisphaerae bacterium]